MISNAEVQRYHDHAQLKLRRRFGSEEEQNLAQMILNLVQVIDHLTNCICDLNAKLKA